MQGDTIGDVIGDVIIVEIPMLLYIVSPKSPLI